MGKTKGHQKMENQETLDAIAAEVRARAKAWPDPSLVQYDERLADRITDAARQGRLNLDALERACEEVLDAETLKAVVAAKRRIQGEPERESECHRSIKIPVKVVQTCNVARAQRRLELLRAEMSDMADRTESGEKYRFNPRAVIAEIDDTLATRPRNCDVFAYALWDRISRAWQDWLLTPEFNKRKIGSMKEFCYWFLGPAKESGVRE